MAGNDIILRFLGKFHVTYIYYSLNEASVKFICSCNRKSFQELASSVVNGKCIDEGEWVGLYHDQKKQTFLKVEDPDPNVGTKYCLSNAFEKKNIKPPNRCAHNIPVWEADETMFNVCDKFNKSIHGYHFPHKSGGKKHPGGNGHQ